MENLLHIALGLVLGLSQAHTHVQVHEDIRWLMAELGVQIATITIFVTMVG